MSVSIITKADRLVLMSRREYEALLKDAGRWRAHLAGKRLRGEVTGKRAARSAARVLRDPKASKDAKRAAGSALTQRPDKKRRKR